MAEGALRLAGSLGSLFVFPCSRLDGPWGPSTREDSTCRLSPLNDTVATDYRTATKFLQGDEDAPKRFQIFDRLTVRMPAHIDHSPTSEAVLVWSWYQRLEFATLLVNIPAGSGWTVDDWVYLNQGAVGSNDAAGNGSSPIEIRSTCLGVQRIASIRHAAELYIARVCTPSSARPWWLSDAHRSRLARPLAEETECFICMEIRGVPHESPRDLIDAHPRELYGLLTQDEGWRYVPRSVAVDRLSDGWGTRQFVSIVSFGRTVLSINLKSSDYEESQSARWHQYHGVEEPYFRLSSSVAGLDHGPLFALERSAIRIGLGKKLLSRNRERRVSGLKKILLARKELIDGLDSLTRPDAKELGELDGRIQEATGVPHTIDEVRDQFALIEARARHAYERRINLMVILIAVFSLAIAVLQLVPLLGRSAEKADISAPESAAVDSVGPSS